MLAIDTGGTFTDLAAYSPDNGELRFTKSLTTHHDLVEGILNCIDKTDLSLADTEFFKHGTTLVINTLIERTGARTALVATRGFRDILEIGRGNRPYPFDLFYHRDPILVRRDLRYEINERMDGRGKPLTVPDHDEVKALAAELRRAGVEAVAVSFLNSYLDQSHENLVTGWLRELLPDVFVTCGTAITREWYEYERSATAAANGYVGPRVHSYIGRLNDAFADKGFAGAFYLMGSMGGVLSLDRTLAEPIQIVESGPVGGCIGAARYAEELGIANLIAFDMGGTTAKSALVQNSQFAVDPIYYVGGYDRGFPIRATVISIVEVGAGGGSIASVDELGRMSVGPRSAGSNPGPVAYGHGGTEPTVTDANLLLGRLDPEKFHGGALRLDVEGAKRAAMERLAGPLGYAGEEGVLRVADGIIAIAELTMGNAIRKITLERGQDPRDFALFAYGGGGPLHAVELARELHIPTVIIPPEPGVFSALGMLLADIRIHDSHTALRPLNDDSIQSMAVIFGDLEKGLLKTLEEEGTGGDVSFVRSADLRYRGQVHTVETPIRTEMNAETLRAAFEEVYRARFGHAHSGNPIDIVTLRSGAHARMRKPDIGKLVDMATSRVPVLTERPVYFSSAGGHVSTKVFERRSLPAGFAEAGPALIEEYGSTTLVGPGDRFNVGTLGEIRIDIGIE